MTDEHIEGALKQVVKILQKAAPYDTGWMANNSIKLERLSTGVWRIYIDEDIAPYAKHTIEPWKGARKNPNEGWWDKEIHQLLLNLQHLLRGELKFE